MSFISIYANLADIWPEIEAEEFLIEICERPENLGRALKNLLNEQDEKGEYIIKALANILEPNGYKIIKQDGTP